MEVFIALLLGCLALFVFWLKRCQSYWSRRGIPHNKPTLVAAASSQHITAILNDVYRQFKGKGPFAGFYFLIMNCVLILDLELVKNILIKDFNNFQDRGLYHNERDDPLTGNIFFMDGDKTRRLRNRLSPTFTSGKMKTMFPMIVKVGRELSAVIGDELLTGTMKEGDGIVLQMIDFAGRFTADVIGSCAFGLECNSLREPSAEFATISRSFFAVRRHSKLVEGLIYSFPNIARRLGMRIINESVHNFFLQLVRETVEFRERTKFKRNDFMDLLIEIKNQNNDMTSEEVAAHAFVFFAAGFETSSTTMGFVLYELARHQDIQQKLREEITDVMAYYEDDLPYEFTKKMPYLDQVINETLRMHPVVPFLLRKARAHYETNDPKYYIEKNTMCIIPTMAIHYDPLYYAEPEKFMPERFAADEIKKRPACTWLPFGEGPRNCIGLRFGKLETSIGLVYLLHKFKFSLSKETKVPYKIQSSNYLLNSENGMHLKVERV